MKKACSHRLAAARFGFLALWASVFVGVGCSKPALEITTTTLPDVQVNGRVDADILAKGGEPPYAFSAMQLPADLQISSLGRISGVAKVPGLLKLIVTVHDSRGDGHQKEIALHVIPDPLVISTVDAPNARQREPYDATLAAMGGVPPYTWTATGALPAGLELASDGHLRGTPTETGSFAFGVRVSGQEQTSGSGTVRLMIESFDPVIDTSALPTARIGTEYEGPIRVTGGTAPYTFSVRAGALPTGLSLSPEGVLSGYPRTPGDFTATLQVTDSSSPPRSVRAELAMHVVAALQIRTTQIAQIIANRPFDFSVEAMGGVPPYTWSIGAGAPPSGITFDASGHFSGTTASAGDFRVTLTVLDSEGVRASSLFTLRVTDSFVYDVNPMLSVPPSCTSTSVSYAFVEIPVPESYQVQDVNVRVDIDYSWDEDAVIQNRGNGRTPGDPRIVLFGPDGSQAPLCGNGASIPGGLRCSNRTQDLHKEYDDEARSEPGQGNRPERPLSVFDGINAQGTWRLAFGVSEPDCGRMGTIQSVRLTVADDRRRDPYLQIQGFRKNNMITDPFVRICSPACAGMVENELFLTARVFEVGPNGKREGGGGDDVEVVTPLTWAWQGGTPLPGVTLEPDGHVQVGDSRIRSCTTSGDCLGTGQRGIVVSGGGLTASMTLLVTPPDWNREVREY